MAAFWAVFTFGGSGPALTAHGSLDLKQEIQIQSEAPVWSDEHVYPFLSLLFKISSLTKKLSNSSYEIYSEKPCLATDYKKTWSPNIMVQHLVSRKKNLSLEIYREKPCLGTDTKKIKHNHP
jgi:Txe/YoeB family toxin of Txe-Axe toxin-antitoxin module